MILLVFSVCLAILAVILKLIVEKLFESVTDSERGVGAENCISGRKGCREALPLWCFHLLREDNIQECWKIWQNAQYKSKNLDGVMRVIPKLTAALWGSPYFQPLMKDLFELLNGQRQSFCSACVKSIVGIIVEKVKDNQVSPEAVREGLAIVHANLGVFMRGDDLVKSLADLEALASFVPLNKGDIRTRGTEPEQSGEIDAIIGFESHAQVAVASEASRNYTSILKQISSDISKGSAPGQYGRIVGVLEEAQLAGQLHVAAVNCALDSLVSCEDFEGVERMFSRFFPGLPSSEGEAESSSLLPDTVTYNILLKSISRSLVVEKLAPEEAQRKASDLWEVLNTRCGMEDADLPSSVSLNCYLNALVSACIAQESRERRETRNARTVEEKDSDSSVSFPRVFSSIWSLFHPSKGVVVEPDFLSLSIVVLKGMKHACFSPGKGNRPGGWADLGALRKTDISGCVRLVRQVVSSRNSGWADLNMEARRILLDSLALILDLSWRSRTVSVMREAVDLALFLCSLEVDGADLWGEGKEEVLVGLKGRRNALPSLVRCLGKTGSKSHLRSLALLCSLSLPQGEPGLPKGLVEADEFLYAAFIEAFCECDLLFSALSIFRAFSELFPEFPRRSGAVFHTLLSRISWKIQNARRTNSHEISKSNVDVEELKKQLFEVCSTMVKLDGKCSSSSTQLVISIFLKDKKIKEALDFACFTSRKGVLLSLKTLESILYSAQYFRNVQGGERAAARLAEAREKGKTLARRDQGAQKGALETGDLSQDSVFFRLFAESCKKSSSSETHALFKAYRTLELLRIPSFEESILLIIFRDFFAKNQLKNFRIWSDQIWFSSDFCDERKEKVEEKKVGPLPRSIFSEREEEERRFALELRGCDLTPSLFSAILDIFYEHMEGGDTQEIAFWFIDSYFDTPELFIPKKFFFEKICEFACKNGKNEEKGVKVARLLRDKFGFLSSNFPEKIREKLEDEGILERKANKSFSSMRKRGM